MSIASAQKASAVTKSDVTVYSPPFRGLYVGGSGTLSLILADDTSAVSFTGVVGGSVLPLSVKQVMSTGTTATDIVGLR